jgi:proteic killer suppression protein
MLVTFAERYLEDLFLHGKTDDKKHRFQPDIVRRYQKGVNALISATNKDTLYALHSLNFEALTGNYVGKFSIRVNLKYRIIFTLTEIGNESLITVCNVEELSNHYQ